MEFVFLLSLSLGLSDFVARIIFFKIAVGSTKWCLIVSMFVAIYVIVHCAFAAGSNSGFRSLNVFSIS